MKENKLIAEFIGDGKEYEVNIKTKTLKSYNTSWDWLMPVVKKVLTIVNINLVNYCVEELKFCVLDNDIDGAFEEVVEFINYLNKPYNN